MNSSSIIQRLSAPLFQFKRLSALKNGNYRRYFIGQFFSLMGNQIQSLGLAWLVYRTTGSGTLLGTVILFNYMGSVCAFPFAGLMTDRFDRRKLLIFLEIVGMAQALTLAADVMLNQVEVWHITLLSILAGVSDGFERTVRQSLSVELVDRSDMPSAVALNSLVVTNSRVLGPLVGGILIKLTSERACFFINAISYLGIIYGLIRMNSLEVRQKVDSGARSIVRDFKEVWHAVQESPQIKTIFLSVPISFAIGLTYQVLFPVLSRVVFDGGAGVLSGLTCAVGAGSVAGSFFFSGKKYVQSVLRQRLSAILSLMGLMFVLLGVSTWIGASVLICFFMGTFLFGSIALGLTTISLNVENKNRGRVTSMYFMANLAASPVCSLVAGFVCDRFGPRSGLIAVGASILFYAIFFNLITLRFSGKSAAKHQTNAAA